MLVEGASNQEISRRLVIRPRAAATHVRGILHETGSANRTRAAMNAVLHRWVETSYLPGGRRPGGQPAAAHLISASVPVRVDHVAALDGQRTPSPSLISRNA